MRNKIVAGNWKMNKQYEHAVELLKNLHEALSNYNLPAQQEVVVCPPHIYLSEMQQYLQKVANTTLQIGAQNCHQQIKGAFTGEISAAMLASVGIGNVILGHSERRAYFNESDELIHKKIKAALAQNIRVIYCCGESLAQREANAHFSYVTQQIKTALFDLSVEEMQQLVIAYEPVWAIGTGKTASPQQAEEMHAHIRNLLQQHFGELTANSTTILYGGSCKPHNAKALFANPNVDGGLIGGASLKAPDFMAIIKSL